MGERKRLFMMNAKQAETFGRLVEAADRGDGAAACRLGDMYREGQGGLRYSPKQTFLWYSRSALAGDANGQNNLGACFEHGLGCRQSYANAIKWYWLAAAERLGTASMNLGYCYLHGHGVRADEGEALRLFRLAVEQGEPKALEELERLEGSLKPSDVWSDNQAAERKWLDLERRAWEKDDCFDLPEPGTPQRRQIEEDNARFWRTHAADWMPRRDDEPKPADLEAGEKMCFSMYAGHDIRPKD